MVRPPEITHVELVGVLPNLGMGLFALAMVVFTGGYLAVSLFGRALLDPLRLEMRRIERGPGAEREDEEDILRRLVLIGRCLAIPFGLSMAWPYWTAAWDALWS
jgi:hypothetical protein